MSRERYHTRGNTPASVRPETVKGWDALWRRLYRRYEPRDRELEFKVGTPFVVGGVDFVIRHVFGKQEAYVRDKWGFWVRLREDYALENELYVSGFIGFCSRKPSVYLDDLQDALDSLLVTRVMSS